MTSSNRPKRLSTIIVTLFVVLVMLVPVFPASALLYGKNVGLNKADAMYYGESSGDQSGYSLANAGDVNGDGISDFIVGAPYRTNGSSAEVGKTYVIFGSKGLKKEKDLTFANASYIGKTPRLHSGWSVAGAGDVNGDGYGDIIIGMPGSDGANPSPGLAYVFFGHSGAWVKNASIETADVVFRGENTSDEAGGSVAGVGDVNGDGYDDILIGARYNSGNGAGAGKAYLVFGRASGWTTGGNSYFELSKANASFMGDNPADHLGYSVAAAGDINRDGLDDLLISAPDVDSINMSIGQAYLIYGRLDKWNKNQDIKAVASATFQGRRTNQRFGTCIAGVGDFDHNSYDDFIVCGGDDVSMGNNFVYKGFLYMSGPNGFKNPMGPGDANASFYEGGFGMASGLIVGAGAGDINGDGFSDIIFGDPTADNSSNSDVGRAYLMTGFATTDPGPINVSLSADSSFIGEVNLDGAGNAVGGVGDFNGDGYSDTIIGAYQYDGKMAIKPGSGKTYVIFPDHNIGPGTVASLGFYSDKQCTNNIDHAAVGDSVYLKLVGGIGSNSRRDITLIKVQSSRGNSVGMVVPLLETEVSSGVYVGTVKLMNRTREEHLWIKTLGNETLTATSVNDTKVTANIFVLGNFKIRPYEDNTMAVEDMSYKFHYWAEGSPTDKITWTTSTNATWLDWLKGTHNLTGTPRNKDVGKYYVNVTISTIYGQTDTHNFTLNVKNALPDITSAITTAATEHRKYSVNMTSSENGSGVITWHLKTNSSWLKLNSTSGEIYGTPDEPDVGKWYANVSVDDGNDGWDSVNSTITVANVNDPPVISTDALPPATEYKLYQFKVNGSDPDRGDQVSWSMAIGAPDWLSINSNSGLLQGTPIEKDVGNQTLQVIVGDKEGLTANRTFIITVVNVNEPPVIKSNPETSAVSGQPYRYEMKVTDPDAGETMTFSLPLCPDGMAINPKSGVITWTPTESQKGPNKVRAQVSDGELVALQDFTIEVIVPSTDVPLAKLTSPQNGSTVNVTNPQLQWSAVQVGPNTLFFDVYLAKDRSKVSSNDPTALVAEDTASNSYFPTTPLETGGNYFWTVIPNDGVHTGLCTNGVWNFSVQQDAVVSKKPTVDLILPENGSTVSTLPVQLSWTGADPGQKSLTYTVFISQELALVQALDSVALRIKDINTTDYTVEGLTRERTYYWTVIPDNGNAKGDCLSGVWSFKVAAAVIVNHPPVISSKALTKTYVGDTYTYQVNASDEDQDTLAFSLTTRPAGMVIDANYGLIMWVVQEKNVGDHRIVIRVSDGHIFTDQAFTLTVLPLSAKNHVPSIWSQAKVNATVGEKYKYSVLAQDQDSGDSLSYSLVTNPDGMTIGPDGSIEWTPKKGQEGPNHVRVQVSDGKAPVYQDFNITVKAAPSPRSTGTWILLLIILVIVIAAIVVVAVALTLRKRAAQAKRTKKETTQVEAQPEAVSSATYASEASGAAAVEPGPAVVYEAPPTEEGVEDFSISEVFLIYNDGRLITYSTIEENAGVDKQIMSGMLIAIQSFVKESFQTQHGLNSFEFGNKKVILKGGKYVILAAVLDGTEPSVLREEMQSVITRIETLYAGRIELWDGNMETFHDVPHYLAPLFRLRSKLKIKEKTKGVRMRSGVEFYSGYVRLKIGVSNELEGTIGNISLDLAYDLNTLRLSHIEPEYPVSDNTVYLPDIQPGEKRTVAVYFDPLICQESHIDGKVRYTDPSGNASEAEMKRRPVDVVCPIFYTPETINVAMLKRLLGELSFSDSRIYEVKDATTLTDAHALAVSCVKGHDVKLVREFVEENPYAVETWFYGEAKESDEKLVIKVSARSTGSLLELFVASDNLASMTGLLAELGKEFRGKMDERGIDRESLLLSTDEKMRGVLKATALLLDKYAESETLPEDTEQKG